MIRNPDLLQEFENDLIRKTPADHTRNLKIVDALYAEARALKVLPLKDPLEGLEVVLSLARVLNSVHRASSKNCRDA